MSLFICPRCVVVADVAKWPVHCHGCQETYYDPPPVPIVRRSKRLLAIIERANRSGPVIVRNAMLAAPGTKLEKMLKELGAKPDKQCKCKAMTRKMNLWGPEGCRKHMDEILAHLAKAYSSLTWTEAGAIGLRAAALGLPLTTRGLVELAIERAETPSPT